MLRYHNGAYVVTFVVETEVSDAAFGVAVVNADPSLASFALRVSVVDADSMFIEAAAALVSTEGW